MAVRQVTSTMAEAQACARDLRQQLGNFSPVFVVFFATSALDSEVLGACLKREFGNVPSLGCTTAGEIGSEGLSKGSVVLMAFDAESVEAAEVRAIENVRDGASIGACLDALASGFGSTRATLDPSGYFGLVVHDGLNMMEEAVMARLTELCNVPFVGGSAGDDLKFAATTVFANFRPLRDTSVLAIVKPRAPYTVLKTQSFRVLDKVLEATSAQTTTRTVHTFNGRPAAEEYARALGLSVEEAVRSLRKHPVGIVMSDGQPFVRGIQQVRGSDMVFYCQLQQRDRVHVLEATDIVAQTRHDLASSIARLGRCSAIINFHCIERTLELEAQGQTEAYGQLFKEVPTIGFSTYGESYIGHINQTSTMVLLG
jgi:hypothetical protein